MRNIPAWIRNGKAKAIVLQVAAQCLGLRPLINMVELALDKTTDFSSTKIQMITSIQRLPLVKQGSFLRAKYEGEGLSVKEIAALTFSSRQTVTKYLALAGVVLRPDDRARTLPFGKRWRRHKIVLDVQEQAAIGKAQQLRTAGLSYEKIARVMTVLRLKTKSGRTQWYAKTVRDIAMGKK